MARIIDIHAHVFNLRYLPVAGILDGSGLIDLPGWLARGLAVLALALTPKDETLDDSSPAAVSPEAEALLEAELAAEAAGLKALLDDFDSRIEEIEARIPDEAWQDRDVIEALRRAQAIAPAQSPKASAAAAAGLQLRMLIELARSLDKARRLERAIDWFFSIATARERTIARILADTYGDVDLFVHHMMDMKNHYRDGKTKYEFWPRQVKRMQALSRASGGRLAAFVAWDPFRDNGLEIVQQAIARHGCIGVKFYPPSGYRPFGNDESDLPRRHVRPPSPEVLNRRMLALFEWCVDKDVPIFTHCTPGGFEAYPCAGLNCAPEYWRRLLESDARFKPLRLCFGHAGGDGWFAANQAEWERSFAKGVAELCCNPDYPNLYCEVGILSDVHDPTARGRFAARVRALGGGQSPLLRRLLYGSDWHMLFMHAGYRDFFRDYQSFSRDAGFTDEQRDDFFGGNAARYLKLG